MAIFARMSSPNEGNYAQLEEKGDLYLVQNWDGIQYFQNWPMVFFEAFLLPAEKDLKGTGGFRGSSS